MRFEPDYFGSKGRIGLIYMASSIVMEPEMYAMAASGVSIHTSRLTLPSVTVEGIETMVRSAEMESAVRLCAQAPLDILLFGGTSASFLHGIAWDEMLKDKLGEWTDVPVTTTASASIAALKSVGAQSIGLVTPYVDEVVKRAESFFSSNGFPVVDSVGLDITEDHKLAEVPLEDIYQMCLEIDSPEMSAIFISCTNFRSVGAIHEIEAAVGKPVISAVQASYWHCLDELGIAGGAKAGYGSLFNS